MNTIENNKKAVEENLDTIKEKLNIHLRGDALGVIEPIIKRIDPSGDFPEWFAFLKNNHTLPELKDGKTVGSVVEKLLVAVLEKYVLPEGTRLSINPARGVDIPELELGVKSPSTNYDTSEPYYSAYERILGNEYDAIILLTNYQETKGKTPFELQIIDIRYLKGSEISDKNLCATAKALREQIIDEASLKKLVRFLAYVNKTDWEASKVLKLIDECLIKGGNVDREISLIEKDFVLKNEHNEETFKPLIPDESLDRIKAVKNITPVSEGIIKLADDWVIQTQKDNGRLPNDNEWHRFMKSPLEGKISLSFALQWRYNFRPLFA